MEIVVPDNLWDGDVEGVLLSWLLTDGSKVSAGEPIAEIMTEKVQNEIVAPATGVLRHGMKADDAVRKGDVVGAIEIAG